MAANDGASTELFTGWSSVVHQPEDEPEESELPSTVDIGALNSGPSDLNQAHNEAESESESEDSEADSSNSDASDASQESCSHSDSSDSDSSSSSQESSSRSPSPEFSVTSSQTNGLRLTIATVRKSISSPINTAKKTAMESCSSKTVAGKVKGCKKSTSTSSSECSSDSESDSDSKSDTKESKTESKSTPLSQKQSQNIVHSSRRSLPPTRSRVTAGGTLPLNSKLTEKEKQGVTANCRVSTGNSNKETVKESPIVTKLKLSNVGNNTSNSKDKDNSRDLVCKESSKDNKKKEKEVHVLSKQRGSPSNNSIGNKEIYNKDITKEREKEGATLSKIKASSNVNGGKDRDVEVKDSNVEKEKGNMLSKLRSNTCTSSVSKDKDSVKEKDNVGTLKLRSSNISVSVNKDKITANTINKDRVKESAAVKGRTTNSGNAGSSSNTLQTTSKEKEGSSGISKVRLQSNSPETSANDNTANKEKDKDGSSTKDKDKDIKVTEKGNKVADAKSAKKKVRLKRRSKKMASLPLSRSSTYSTSDSESSDDLLPSSCSLQEIRDEDLAAILPDQNECNDFNDFDKNDKGSPATGDMSGSDMELPQQAINSLIQRTTESSSDGEGHQLPNPQTLFANSLLQQFVANNPLLSPPSTQPITNNISDISPPKSNSTANMTINSSNCQNPSMTVNNKDLNDSCSSKINTNISNSLRKRRGRPGRPKKGTRRGRQKDKVEDEVIKVLDAERPKHVQDFCGGPNVSPDSGIQNSPDHVSSPEPCFSLSIRSKPLQKKEEPKKKSTNISESKPPSKTLKTEKPSLSNHNMLQEKPKEPVTKISVTSNQFDRVLYANSDRVLYPPRRKGRPPISRRPGRPPKHKIESVEVKNVEKSLQNIKGKGRNKTVLSNNNSKQTVVKNRSLTLKVPKIFHSRHKQKHKKRKIKILKPLVSCDPKINQEIEKLIVDFVRLCVIATKQPKENVPEQILKTLKKVTKKRRTTDHMEKKKKKQSISTTVNKVHNSNEQRLPLKKRHYHLMSNSSESQKIEPEESKEKIPEKTEEVKNENKEVKTKVEKKEKAKDGKLTPKYVPVIKSHINNNEYELKVEKSEKEGGSHVDEAVGGCITRFSDKKQPQKEEKLSEDKIVAATTPKKRHRLENLSSNPETIQINLEKSVEIKTELVTANLEERIEKLKPKISVEAYINELKIKRNVQVPKNTIASVEDDGKQILKDIDNDDDQKEGSALLQVEKTVQVSPESTKKKVRKRRAFNRTGFPTVKKKKKRAFEISSELALIEAEEDTNKTLPSACDRVPKEGEEYTKFVQRSNNSSLNDLTTIDKSVTDDLMSECESLPQDERTDFDVEDSSSRSESINESSSESRSKKSEGFENESMSLLESSIERLKFRLDQKKRKRSKDLKNPTVEINIYPKRRRREDSPASSIEPSIESRLRDSTSASGDEYNKKSKKVPRYRKKFLLAGLFSDYYKEEESKRQETTRSSRNLIYNMEEHPYGLLPPPYHCGKYLRCRRVDFQLPYDLWWQHMHSQLPGRDVVPSWNYKKIRTNVYNIKTNGGACEPQSCNCKQTSNCGDDCINRLVLAECPATHRCNNQRIQRHDWAPGIEKFMTEHKGWGVRTKEPIKQGEFILEYVGEVVADQEFKERMNSIYVNDTHHYCLHLDGGLVIDGHRMGGDGRFVNHSCQPNCEMQKWSVNGQFRMALFALRDIESYEELTYDYNFSLFNPAEGQECKCGSENCRGVIGGKTQRIRQLPESVVAKNPGRVGRPRKTEAKKKPNATKDNIPSNPQPPQPVVPQIQVKPMSHQQKCFILEHHCFLLRNLTKVRKVRDRSQSISSTPVPRQQTATPTDTSAFMNQLNALQKPRNMKTRRIAQAEDDPELNKTVKLATILKDILEAITSAKDDKNLLLSTNLMQLPSKRKVPEFYQRVSEPVDLTTIEQNIATGVYKNPQSFDSDMCKLFSGFAKFYDRTTDTGIATAKLKKIYVETKQQSLAKFEDILGEKPPPTFVSNKKKNEEEDIIRCICGIPRDEGLMIQCERCMVWQHIECVKADASVASYHCEICVPRSVDYEIPMDEFTEHGHRYYMTLMRNDLQLRQGDTVYVLRDIPIEGTNKKHTYDTIGKIDYSELDIFRIERLWKDKDNGKRFAYGHHYLRPHETFHEPTRKFFPNEVMRVPLYEAVPVELIMEHCWVMDINTFCKGRPIGAQEQHVYICEYRVDKGAKMFSKTSKTKFPICTKSFAFERFETRLKISRTYCPHDVDSTLMKNNVGRKKEEKDKDKGNSKDMTSIATSQVHHQPSPPPIQRTPTQQKARLNKILLNLLSKMPTKQVLDVSYLLEGGRRRKKQDTKQ